MKTPRLPGQDLASVGLEDGTCLYDPENPEAYLIGEALSVGTTDTV